MSYIIKHKGITIDGGHPTRKSAQDSIDQSIQYYGADSQNDWEIAEDDDDD